MELLLTHSQTQKKTVTKTDIGDEVNFCLSSNFEINS